MEAAFIPHAPAAKGIADRADTIIGKILRRNIKVGFMPIISMAHNNKRIFLCIGLIKISMYVSSMMCNCQLSLFHFIFPPISLSL